MKTVSEWLTEIINDPNKFNDWLEKQYIGELGAWERVSAFAETLPQNSKIKEDILSIAEDELRHSAYIGAILIQYDIDVEDVKEREARNLYWDKTLFWNMTTSQLCAVGAHAEAMRLERISAIRDCPAMPKFIRKIFDKIYVDEMRHTSLFRKWCSDEDFEEARVNHESGLNALGLTL